MKRQRPPNHPDLFGGSYARGSDPQPSHDAATRNRFDVQRLEAMVISILRECGTWQTVLQMEASETAKAMGKDKWSISPRMKPLETKGKVERAIMIGLNSNGKIRKLTHWRIKPDNSGVLE